MTTDRAIGDAWLVTKGLSAGDRVIVKGVQMAKPGQEVVANEVDLAVPGDVAANTPPAQK